ncbi:MAG: hypothetical protein ACRELV_06800 [Longimicrobiales bacterium]
MKRPKSRIAQGAWAGALAAIAVAVWFLIIDIAGGQAFRTPAFLFAVLTGSPFVELGLARVATFTVLHFLAFTALGIAVALATASFRTVPGVLLGFILGFLLFDLTFYGSVWITGVNVALALGWPEVLAGNVIAGVTLLGALHVLGATRPVSWHEILDRHAVVKEGLVAGVLGASAVALWFLVLDVILGHVLLTPAALGSIVFYGARGMGSVRVDAVTILGYSAIHVAAFVATGMVAAALAAKAEERGGGALILGAVLLFTVFEVFFIGVIAIIANWLLEVIPWWSVLVGNLIAAFSMGWYLWRRHPKLGEDMQAGPLEEQLVEDRSIDARSAAAQARARSER